MASPTRRLDHLRSIVSGIDRVPHVSDKGYEAFLDDSVDQLVAALEIVVHHGRGQAGTLGNEGKRSRGDAVLGDKFGGCHQ